MSDMGAVSLVAFVIGGGIILFMVCYSIEMMASVAREAIRAKVKLEELRRPKND